MTSRRRLVSALGGRQGDLRVRAATWLVVALFLGSGTVLAEPQPAPSVRQPDERTYLKQDGGNWFLDSVLSGGRATPLYSGTTWNGWAELVARITSTPPPATLSVTFNGLGRLARLGDTAVPAFALSDVAILARHDVGGDCRHDVPAGPMRCLRVVVRMGGSVRMCDPARPAGDPQAC